MLGSVAYLDAANVGDGNGLDPDGHRVECIGFWVLARAIIEAYSA